MSPPPGHVPAASKAAPGGTNTEIYVKSSRRRGQWTRGAGQPPRLQLNPARRLHPGAEPSPSTRLYPRQLPQQNINPFLPHHPPPHIRSLGCFVFPPSIHPPFPLLHGSRLFCSLLMGVTIYNILREAITPKKNRKKPMHQHRDCMRVSCFILKKKKYRTRQKCTLMYRATAPGPSSMAPAPFSPCLSFSCKKPYSPWPHLGSPKFSHPAAPGPCSPLLRSPLAGSGRAPSRGRESRESQRRAAQRNDHKTPYIKNS